MSSLSQIIQQRMQTLQLNQTQLARRVGVSQVTIHKLLSGKTTQTSRIADIAKALECSTEFLLNQPLYQPSAALKNVTMHYPLFDWNDVSSILAYNVSSDTPFFPCPIASSERTFVLQIQGMSMEPIFFQHDLVFIDPDIEPQHEKYVATYVAKEEKIIVKQLIVDDGQCFLKAKNPHWPTPIRLMRQEDKFLGVVIFCGRAL